MIEVRILNKQISFYKPSVIEVHITPGYHVFTAMHKTDRVYNLPNQWQITIFACFDLFPVNRDILGCFFTDKFTYDLKGFEAKINV